ncbi:hypothetical protein [Xanthobacter tagetidis]|uniref:hypothetical protein n=1 Tax=Xanthobacter tagetidis TaxID=60216 RepID=UPI0014741006|nr:hypothetical protein [Xanthobacter tagetidis]MBB6309516.1 hypothetical protein [Xanthobacter tagetidis]
MLLALGDGGENRVPIARMNPRGITLGCMKERQNDSPQQDKEGEQSRQRKRTGIRT